MKTSCCETIFSDFEIQIFQSHLKFITTNFNRVNSRFRFDYLFLLPITISAFAAIQRTKGDLFLFFVKIYQFYIFS